MKHVGQADAASTPHRSWTHTEVILLVSQQLGAQCGARDVQQILTECGLIGAVVLGRLLQGLAGNLNGTTPT